MSFVFKIFKIIFWGFVILFGIGFIAELVEKVKGNASEKGVSFRAFVEHIPGYRSNMKWKKIIATLYYLIIITSLLDSFSLFLFLLSIPFLLTSIIDLFKAAKNKAPYKSTAILCVVSLLAFSISLGTMSASTSNDVAENDVANINYEEDKGEQGTSITSNDNEVVSSDIEDGKSDSSGPSDNPIEKDNNHSNSNANSTDDNSEYDKKASSGESSGSSAGTSASSDTGNPDNASFEDKSETDKEFEYIGNSGTKKFHYTYCGSADKITESNRVYFNSRDDAINRGYVPCKRCNP